MRNDLHDKFAHVLHECFDGQNNAIAEALGKLGDAHDAFWSDVVLNYSEGCDSGKHQFLDEAGVNPPIETLVFTVTVETRYPHQWQSPSMIRSWLSDDALNYLSGDDPYHTLTVTTEESS